MTDPYVHDPDFTLHVGDALDVLRELPSESVHMCVTSPPFFGLRDYLVEGQIGLEASPDEWVARLVDVFREVRRVLRKDGTLWLEIGDSYGANSQGSPKPSAMTKGHVHGHVPNSWGGGQATPIKHPTKPKDLIGAPWLLAEALKAPYYTGRIKDEGDRKWLAAIIDGEGSINIHRRKAGTPNYSTFERKDGTTAIYERKNDSYQPKLEISNTNRELLERVVALTGEGHTNTKQEAGTFGRKQTIYRWCVTADKARAILREVYPHLVAKQQEARLAYGCPSSGDKAAEAHEALKALHRGESTGIDFREPETMFEAGWYLRSDIIWARLGPNPMPESVRDRPTKSHSYVFLLSKSPRYFFDQEAVREPHDPNSPFWKSHPNGQTNTRLQTKRDGTNDAAPIGWLSDLKPTQGRNIRSVWTIPTEPLPDEHYAAYPQKLVERAILAGSSERGCCPECGAPWERVVERVGGVPTTMAERTFSQPEAAQSHSGGLANGGAPVGGVYETRGWRSMCGCALSEGAGMVSGEIPGQPNSLGHETPAPSESVPCVVLDPFLGSGTTALVARRLGRHTIGIELSPTYAAMAARRLQQLSLLA